MESWWVTGCNEKQLHDCITKITGCNLNDGAAPESKGRRIVETFPVGGTPGQRYKVTFRYSGLTEAKHYAGGTRDAGNATPVDVDKGIWDTFYRDGSSPESNYDVLKLTIFDHVGTEQRHYYMNSFPTVGYESHRTFLAQYEKSIVIVGGGTIQHLLQDKNCHSIDNCKAGEVSGEECSAARKLPVPDDVALLPPFSRDAEDGQIKAVTLLSAAYPGATRAQPWHAQVAKLTVLSISETDDPVTTNYP